jgi:hypothetical protein
MVHGYSFFGSTADFVIKKEQLGFLPEIKKTKCHAKIDIFLIDSEEIKYLEHFKIKIIRRHRH